MEKSSVKSIYDFEERKYNKKYLKIWTIAIAVPTEMSEQLIIIIIIIIIKPALI